MCRLWKQNVVLETSIIRVEGDEQVLRRELTAFVSNICFHICTRHQAPAGHSHLVFPNLRCPQKVDIHFLVYRVFGKPWDFQK